MINEVEEFICYTGEAAYTAAGKKDLSWMRRLPFNMLKDFEGFGRVLTVVARGFLFEENEPDPERARRALCAWCSIPEDPDAPKKDWEYRCGFSELNEEFPTLIGSEGNGWLYRHVQGMTGFVKAHPELVTATAIRHSQELEASFADSWRKKVRQLQVPLFSLTREAAWGMSFDSVVADALELGPLRPWETEFPESETERLHGLVPDVRIERAARLLLAFYYANKPEDSEWVVLPVTNFDAYLQTTSFSRKWLPALDGLLIERSAQSYGISRYKPPGESLTKNLRAKKDYVNLSAAKRWVDLQRSLVEIVSEIKDSRGENLVWHNLRGLLTITLLQLYAFTPGLLK